VDRAGDLGQRHFLVEQQWNKVASKHNSRAASVGWRLVQR
jgi:hypothetical protein